MYLKLFEQIAKSAEQLSERVYAFDKDKSDEENAKVAATMREDYHNLAEKLSAASFDSLDRKDYAKILVGIYIVINQLEAKIKQEQKVVTMYKADLVPKLDQIINEKDDSQIKILAQNLFKNSET